jgi:alpha-galactosidase
MPETDDPTPSRRALLKGAAAAAVGPVLGRPMSDVQGHTYSICLPELPDIVRAFGPDNREIPLEGPRGDSWQASGVEIQTVVGDPLRVLLRSDGHVSRIQLRWRADLRAWKLFLGDHWERSYADLSWRGDEPNRVMPWYFLAFDGKRTLGYGVMTGAGAMCFWTADSEGISLWADVRSGGAPVALGDRTLEVAKVVCRVSEDGEGAYAAAHKFCRKMCPAPRLPEHPIYGTNDWNYAYGNNSAELIANVSGLISELSPNHANRPYSVIDEGWAQGPFEGRFGHGPWVGNPRFGDMGAFAGRLKSLGVRPGIWFRPLTPLPDTPASWRSGRTNEFLDPTIPEVKRHVAEHIRRFVGWGYEIIKHDFTTFDLFGQWGFQMGPSPTHDGWRLHDTSRTNAEILSDLYRTIREAAGEAALIGCNTVGHLAAGTHEAQRIGDDTSGRSWNRNRRMGVNALGFRAVQHRAFFEADPDIVAITHIVPWDLVEQWLRLVSRSGVALFVAVEPAIVEPKHRAALREALSIAAERQPTGEPLDWMETQCPRRWRLRGKTEEFAWMGPTGAWPFDD